MQSSLSMSTGYSASAQAASAQAAQLIQLTPRRDYGPSDMPFLDNLDYLQALEEEAKVILIRGLLRRNKADWQSNPEYARAISLAGTLPNQPNPDKLDELLAVMEKRKE